MRPIRPPTISYGSRLVGPANPTAAAPYQVTSATWRLRELQPPQPRAPALTRLHGPQRPHPAAFLVLDAATLTLTYDQTPTDPRTTQTLHLEHDAFGTPLRTAALAWPRRGTAHAPEQSAPAALLTTRHVLHDVTGPDRLQLAIPWQLQRHELGGLTVPGPGHAWTRDTLLSTLSALDHDLDPHEATPSSGTWRRLLAHEVLRYADPATGNPLEAGTPLTASPALPYDHHVLAFTTDLLGSPTGLDARADWSSTDRDTALSDAGYVLDAATFAGSTPHADFSPPTDAVWMPSPTTTYGAAADFYQPTTQTDPFGTVTTLTWDPHHLHLVAVDGQPAYAWTHGCRIQGRTPPCASVAARRCLKMLPDMWIWIH